MAATGPGRRPINKFQENIAVITGSLRLTVFVVAVLALFAGMGVSADYQSMTNEQLSAIRGTLGSAPPEERDAFRSEWTTRLEKMTPAEREQYIGTGPGRGNGLKDGTGSPGIGRGNGPGDGSGGGSGGNGNGKGRS